MRLSAPLYRLKRLAKGLSREEKIPLNEALDRIALKEGFNSWSLLAARTSIDAPARELLAKLNSGDLVLIGARPGHGKTLMSLELIAEGIKQGHQGVFFTLEYNESDVLNSLRDIGVNLAVFNDQFEFDNSDNINSDYIMNRLETAPRGSIVVVDYLQLLDQKRENPELNLQVQALKSFARKSGMIIVFISQIDRSYDALIKPFPQLEDVRTPNPVDLTLFDKTCFLNNGEVQINATG